MVLGLVQKVVPVFLCFGKKGSGGLPKNMETYNA